jgi:DnaJ-class molecular chaperone
MHGGFCIQFTQPCPVCGGNGLHGHRCNHCHGTGVFDEGKDLHFTIPPAPASLELRVVGDGDAALNIRPGDFVFKISVKPHPLFMVSADNFHNLVYDITIPLHSARSGFKLEIPTLSGRDGGHLLVEVPGQADIESQMTRTFFLPGFSGIGGLHVNCQVK